MEKSIKKLAEKIEARNEAFNKMSGAQKRVEIARDCLNRIALNQFIPSTQITCGINRDFIEANHYTSIKDVLSKQKLPDCEACAKGGLFLSYVGVTNDFNFGSIHDTSNLESNEMQKLLEIFEDLQLDGIEAAFESSIINNSSTNDKEYSFLYVCTKYRNKIGTHDPSLVLKSICKNIIKNKGEFVPTDFVSPNAKIS